MANVNEFAQIQIIFDRKGQMTVGNFSKDSIKDVQGRSIFLLEETKLDLTQCNGNICQKINAPPRLQTRARQVKKKYSDSEAYSLIVEPKDQ